MQSNERTMVNSCQELLRGDAVEAFCKNTLVHRGPVTATAPDQVLFWILDTPQLEDDASWTCPSWK